MREKLNKILPYAVGVIGIATVCGLTSEYAQNLGKVEYRGEILEHETIYETGKFSFFAPKIFGFYNQMTVANDTVTFTLVDFNEEDKTYWREVEEPNFDNYNIEMIIIQTDKFGREVTHCLNYPNLDVSYRDLGLETCRRGNNLFRESLKEIRNRQIEEFESKELPF